MRLLSLLILLFGLHATAFSQENILSQVTDETPPLEEYNEEFSRLMHDLNFFLDGVFVTPVAKIYRRVLPEVVRDSVDNFFVNLSEPYSAMNHFLQGKPEEAGNAARRFFINIVTLGLIDIAEDIGYEHNPEDFGQTLAVWGVPNGDYIVLPLLGPNTLRSVAGLVPDTFLDPMRVAVKDETNPRTVVILEYGETVHNRSLNTDALTDLKDNTVDFYESIKSVYWQTRNADINR